MAPARFAGAGPGGEDRRAREARTTITALRAERRALRAALDGRVPEALIEAERRAAEAEGALRELGEALLGHPRRPRPEEIERLREDGRVADRT